MTPFLSFPFRLVRELVHHLQRIARTKCSHICSIITATSFRSFKDWILRTVARKKLPKDQLTERQLQIIETIRHSIKTRGFPPTIREIGDATGLKSSSSVNYQLRELERKGFLHRDPHKKRAVGFPAESEPSTTQRTAPYPIPMIFAPVISSTIPRRLRNHPFQWQRYPVLFQMPIAPQLLPNSVSALPETSEPQPNNQAEAEGSVVKHNLICWQIEDTAMAGAGILPGDFVVVVSKLPEEDVADVIAHLDPDKPILLAANLDHQLSVRQFHRDAAGTWLYPRTSSDFANDGGENVPISASDANVIGHVVAIIRATGLTDVDSE